MKMLLDKVFKNITEFKQLSYIILDYKVDVSKITMSQQKMTFSREILSGTKIRTLMLQEKCLCNMAVKSANLIKETFFEIFFIFYDLNQQSEFIFYKLML
jgi:hypothetical protein